MQITVWIIYWNALIHQKWGCNLRWTNVSLIQRKMNAKVPDWNSECLVRFLPPYRYFSPPGRPCRDWRGLHFGRRAMPGITFRPTGHVGDFILAAGPRRGFHFGRRATPGIAFRPNGQILTGWTRAASAGVPPNWQVFKGGWWGFPRGQWRSAKIGPRAMAGGKNWSAGGKLIWGQFFCFQFYWKFSKIKKKLKDL